MAAYALAGWVLALRFWPLWRTAVGVAFFSGAVMLAMSVAVDAFLAMLIIEDVAKLIGVLAWCFCGVWAHSERSAVTSPSPSAQRN